MRIKGGLLDWKLFPLKLHHIAVRVNNGVVGRKLTTDASKVQASNLLSKELECIKDKVESHLLWK